MASTRTPAGSGLVACIGEAPVLAGKGGRGSDDDDACGQRDPIFLLILTVNCTQCRFNFYFFRPKSSFGPTYIERRTSDAGGTRFTGSGTRVQLHSTHTGGKISRLPIGTMSLARGQAMIGTLQFWMAITSACLVASASKENGA